jgi:hypothetical protein
MRKWDHKRTSRGGKDSHPSGNRVRHAAPTEEPDTAPQRTPQPVSLPKLTFLERKKIAGELI